jgi:hypothetical protein
MAKITKLDFVSSHRTGILKGVTLDEVKKVLGIKPTRNTCEKVKYEFCFSVKLDGETHECAIWDYKGSYDYALQWSTFGPSKVFTHLFGTAYTHEG